MNYPNALKTVYEKQLFTTEECERIFAAHERIEITKGDYVLKEKQIAHSYCIVESGLLRAYVFDFNKLDITTNFFTENEVAIEVSSLFQHVPSQENIQALTDCILWKIEFNTFQKTKRRERERRKGGRSVDSGVKRLVN